MTNKVGIVTGGGSGHKPALKYLARCWLRLAKQSKTSEPQNLGIKRSWILWFPPKKNYQSALGAGSDFIQALQQMADAAEQGKESTRDLVAKIGRAGRLGERSRGTLDAGATSCSLILKTFARVLSGA